ncbi:MAG: type I 3-dehydroquinate dehydratase [Sutterella wadsworthensis]
MKTVQIKNITVGEGAPKIIVSLMAKDLAAVKSEAAAYAAADFDILEWRGDHFAAVTDSAAVLEALRRCAPLSRISPFSSPSAPSTKAAKPN